MIRTKLERVYPGQFTALLLLLLLFSYHTFSKEISLNGLSAFKPGADIKIQSLNSSEIVIKININSLEVNNHPVLEDYEELFIQRLSRMAEEGKPALPVWRKFLITSEDAKISVRIFDAEEVSLDSVNVVPAPEPQRETESGESPKYIPDQSIYNADSFYPEQNAELISEGIIRGRKIVLLSVNPVRFNPIKKELKILKSFSLSVNIAENGDSERLRKFSHPAFESFLKGLAFNRISPVPYLQKSSGFKPDKSLYGCEYLIITDEKFLEAADSLALWKRMTGLNCNVVTVSEIGYSPEAIQEYIKDAYYNWDIPPVYVLFLGDAEYIPVNYYTNHPSEDNGRIATDLYYVTVDGADYYPDIFYGRIPVDTPLEALSFIEKVIKYEKEPYSDPEFYKKAEVIAYFQDDDDPDTPNYNERDGYADRRFTQTSEEIRDLLLSMGYDAERIYYAKPEVNPLYYNNGSYSNGEPLPQDLLRANGFTWDGDANDISAGIEEGRFLVTHRDHGSRSGWGEPSYKTGHVNALRNGEKLPIVFSTNCATGWFDNEIDDAVCATGSSAECFVEAWIRNFLGGAIGVFGSTRVSYSGYNDALVKGFFDAIFPHFLTFGLANNQMLEPGRIINYGKFYMASEYSGGSRLRVEFEEFHYFGDPAMELRIRQPEPLYIFTDSLLQFNQEQLIVNVPDSGITVSLVQDNQLIAQEISASAGPVQLSFSPLSSETPVTLCGYAYNTIPFIKTIPVMHSETSGLVCRNFTISDQNQDEKVNPGEWINWEFEIVNNTGSSIENIVLQLNSRDEGITIQDSVEHVPIISESENLKITAFRVLINKETVGRKVELSMSMNYGKVSVEYPLDFFVEEGEPQLRIEPSLIAKKLDTQVLEIDDTLHLENSGFGSIGYELQNKNATLEWVGEDSSTDWYSFATGMGNIYFASGETNLIRFGYCTKVISPGTLYFFVYEGDEFRGDYRLVKSRSFEVTQTGVSFISSPELNCRLKEGKYYYLGISWEAGDFYLNWLGEVPQVSLSFGAIVSGCINTGGAPPDSSVTQRINQISPFWQFVQTGEGGNWVNGLPVSGTLNSVESIDIPLNFSLTTDTDSTYFTQLVFTTTREDTFIIPVVLRKGDAEKLLVASLSNESISNKTFPGDTINLNLEIANLGTDPVEDLEAVLKTNNTDAILLDSIESIVSLASLHEYRVDAFKLVANPSLREGDAVDLKVLLYGSSGIMDSLFYSMEIREGEPRLSISDNEIYLETHQIGDTIDYCFQVKNTGNAPLHFSVENADDYMRQIGTGLPSSWFPLGSGCGNIHYQMFPKYLREYGYNFIVDSAAVLYFYLYEADSLPGVFSQLALDSLNVNGPDSGWIYQPVDKLLEANKYYLTGVSWTGNVFINRAKESVPFQTQSGIVYSSIFNLGSIPPDSIVEITMLRNYPVVQRLKLGEGSWLFFPQISDTLLPGESSACSLEVISSYMDTMFNAEILLHSNDLKMRSLSIPISFVASALPPVYYPESPFLMQNYPNPFNNVTNIHFNISEPAMTDISIYNLLGQKIVTLNHDYLEPLPVNDTYHLEWDGRTAKGKKAASGIYFLVLKTGEKIQTRKMIYMK